VLVISFVNKDNGGRKGGEASWKRVSRVPKSKYWTSGVGQTLYSFSKEDWSA